MRFHVLTIFPDMFSSPLAEGVVGRAVEKGLVQVNLRDPREFTSDRHRTVDDYTFGGGPGMLIKPQPIFDAVERIREDAGVSDNPVILLTPSGRKLTQGIVEELATQQDPILICGRYEGVDERVREHLATDEISIGDYVLSGGELAAMVIIDAVSRLVAGVVGSIESTEDDSFTTGLLQYPLYTRPADFRGMRVPDMLLSGNHAEIERWRRRESLRRTLERRPDLLAAAMLSPEDRAYLAGLGWAGEERRADG